MTTTTTNRRISATVYLAADEVLPIGLASDFANHAEAEAWAREVIREAADEGHAWAALTEEVYYAPADIWEPYASCVLDDDRPHLATWEG